MSRYINPFTDIGFKRIFGQELSKPLLIDFLNNLLKGERHITDLTFLDKEQLGQYNDDRVAIYDIFCETDTGEKIIVEMQNRNQSFFINRSVFYGALAIARQGEKGMVWEYDIHAVYVISFLNFSLSGLRDKFRVDVALMDMQDKTVVSDKLRLVYLQLPKFNKAVDECENDFERWIYVLKNMEHLSKLPIQWQNSVFKRLSEISEVSELSHEERVKYDVAIKRFRDAYSTYKFAEREGRAEGRAEGQKMEKNAIARRMKSQGLPFETISQATELTVEEIEKL